MDFVEDQNDVPLIIKSPILEGKDLTKKKRKSFKEMSNSELDSYQSEDRIKSIS